MKRPWWLLVWGISTWAGAIYVGGAEVARCWATKGLLTEAAECLGLTVSLLLASGLVMGLILGLCGGVVWLFSQGAVRRSSVNSETARSAWIVLRGLAAGVLGVLLWPEVRWCFGMGPVQLSRDAAALIAEGCQLRGAAVLFSLLMWFGGGSVIYRLVNGRWGTSSDIGRRLGLAVTITLGADYLVRFPPTGWDPAGAWQLLFGFPPAPMTIIAIDYLIMGSIVALGLCCVLFVCALVRTGFRSLAGHDRPQSLRRPG